MNTLKPVILMLLCGALPLPASAAIDASIDSVEAGKQALESRRELPWYDTEQDELQPIDVQPRPDDLKRQSDWSATPQANRPRGRLSPLLVTILRALAWIALSLLVAAIIWALVWAAMRAEKTKLPQLEVHEAEVGESRLEELPVEVSPQITDLLGAARAFYESGDLGKAIIYAFAHQLVELDKHHLIQLTKGKTNRQYIGELRAHPRFIELLTPIMLAFEDVFFGHHEISLQRFQACWEVLSQFHDQLEQVAL